MWLIICLVAIAQNVSGHGHNYGEMLSEMSAQAKRQLLFEIENFQGGHPDETTQEAHRKNAQGSQQNVTLATFDGTPETSYSWRAMNDPVMGGKSHSSFNVEQSEGHFVGYCANVPFLKAPGFCKIGTESSYFRDTKFADASPFISGALYLEVETTTPDYQGFKVAFGAKNATCPPGSMHHSAPTFKADFEVSGNSRTTVKVPFTSFSVDWSDFTGRCDTKDPNNGFQHHCCSAAHPEVCPTAEHLAHITSLEIWAEGVEGQFDLRIISIAAGPLEDTLLV